MLSKHVIKKKKNRASTPSYSVTSLNFRRVSFWRLWFVVLLSFIVLKWQEFPINIKKGGGQVVRSSSQYNPSQMKGQVRIS